MQGLGSYLKKTGRIHLGELCSLITHPKMTLIRLRLSGSNTILSIVHSLFPFIENMVVEEYRLQFLRNRGFFQELNAKFISGRLRRVNCEGWPELIYILIRIQKPSFVVETGVFDGISSAVILQALQDNNKGRLISVDLPAQKTIEFSTHRMKETTLPPGKQPGWAVPDYLRSRHKLLLGNSKEVLPGVFKDHPSIDVFLHDSLHTYEHQWFEYEIAWPHLIKGGLLLSDDILWNPAFYKFSKEKNRPCYIFSGFGAILK